MQLSIRLPEIPITVTREQFSVIAAENADLRLERTRAGELIVNPPAGSESGRVNLIISAPLWVWAEANPGLGVASDSSAGFELPNGATRAPDASWVQLKRWNALTQVEKEGFAPLCPDFVIELSSKTDRLTVLQAKMQEYLENGARLGWLIDMQNKRVEVYRPGREVESLEQSETLSGKNVLPPFALSLTRIWD
ncbi:MAG: Uma2 family endonuclease [Cyanobacteria bacterium P01_H01_bin.15]